MGIAFDVPVKALWRLQSVRGSRCHVNYITITLSCQNAGEILEDTCYHASSLTNQSIASSRVLNLWNSRWEKVFNAS